jgi:hypothetical protein
MMKVNAVVTEESLLNKGFENNNFRSKKFKLFNPLLEQYKRPIPKAKLAEEIEPNTKYFKEASMAKAVLGKPNKIYNEKVKPSIAKNNAIKSKQNVIIHKKKTQKEKNIKKSRLLSFKR